MAAQAMRASKRPEKKEKTIDDMPPEKLAEFVIEWIEGRVFSSWHMDQQHNGSLIHVVFMPLALGALSNLSKKAIEEIALVYEFTYARGQVPGRAINGMPMFTSCRLMNKRDWEKARTAINRELDRRKNAKEEILGAMVDDMVEKRGKDG
jgi:hypothetical protein